MDVLDIRLSIQANRVTKISFASVDRLSILVEQMHADNFAICYFNSVFFFGSVHVKSFCSSVRLTLNDVSNGLRQLAERQLHHIAQHAPLNFVGRLSDCWIAFNYRRPRGVLSSHQTTHG